VEILELKLQLKQNDLDTCTASLSTCTSEKTIADDDLIARTAERDTYKGLLEQCGGQLLTTSEASGNAQGQLSGYMSTVTGSVCGATVSSDPSASATEYPACIVSNAILGTGTKIIKSATDEETCSKKCQQVSAANCATWTYDTVTTDNKRCYLYAEVAAENILIVGHFSGLRDCYSDE